MAVDGTRPAAVEDLRRLTAVHDSGLLAPERRDLLDHVAEMLQLAMDVPVATVSAVLDDHEVVVGLAGAVSLPADRTRQLAGTPAADVVASGAPVHVPDAAADDRLDPDESGFDAAAWCGAPLMDDDGMVLGVVAVADTSPRTWTAADADRLQHIVPVLQDQIDSFRRTSRSASTTRRAAGDAERARTELAASARQLDAVRATVEDFLGVAAHDLRSPMSTALTVIDTMQHLGDRVDTSAMLDTLQRSITRSLRLLDRLHAHARAGTVELRTSPVDLNVVVRGVLDDMSAALSARGVTVHQPAYLPMVHGDDVLLGQLLGNLLGNAIRYATEHRDEANVWIEAEEGDDGVHLTIGDDGPGLDPEVAAHVFTAGVRGARGAEGIGLGLATCRTIVERHGGRIWIDRRPGGGARVNVQLPAVVRDARRVLVLEDDPDLQSLYDFALRRHQDDLEYRTASTLAQAAEVLRTFPLSAGDLAVVDLHLPDGVAIDFITGLVARDVQVHAVSNAAADDAVVRAALDAGASVTSKTKLVARGFDDLAARLVGRA